MAHHVVRHSGVIGLRAWLVDNVAHGHRRIGRNFRRPLREIDPSDPQGRFPSPRRGGSAGPMQGSGSTKPARWLRSLIRQPAQSDD
jgi:hypothetical protein